MKPLYRTVVANAGLAVAYAGIAKLGLLLALPHTNATPVWFPAGLALGAILRWGPRLWPGVALGAGLSNLFFLAELGWAFPAALAAAGSAAAGNTLEALVGAYLIRRFTGGRDPFAQGGHVFVFVAGGAMVATALSATVGMTTNCLASGNWGGGGGIWLTWWLGDAVGVLVAAPLILTWQALDWTVARRRRAAEMLLLAAGIFVVAWVVFTYAYSVNFLVVLLLLVAVFRLGQFGSAVVVLFLCVASALRIAQVHGIVAGWSQQGALLVNQGFIGVMAVATLLLSAILRERAAAGELLRASAQRTRLILENLADLVAVLDLEGRHIYYSPSYGAILGSAEQLRGSSYFARVHPEDVAEVRAAFAETVQRGAGHRLEYRLVDRAGQPRQIESQSSVIRDADGQVSQVVVVCRDVTERRRAAAEVRRLHEELQQHAEQLERRVNERTTELQGTQGALMNMVEDLNEKTRELALAKERAETADRVKSAFLATMSHELRTPLNSIIGFTGIILDGLAGPLNPEQERQLAMVQNSARHLLALINDVLDISKIEAAQLKVTREPMSVPAAVANVVGIVRPLAEKKGLALQVEVAPEIGTIRSDPRRVEQVLLNLINNAIKFTEQGGVTLRVGREQSAAATRGAGGVVRFDVCDTGIGLKPESLATLFQPFKQVDSGLSRSQEGTGLGLAICRRLAELMGGSVTVESEWGKGSVFTFRLPENGEEKP